jgi:uncharacterized protein
MKRILSIDGGGIRGIIPAMALQTLENATGKRIQDMFDMFVGTSTGGIIALALARGKSPTEIVDLFEKRGEEIFSKPFWWLGLSGPKYKADGLRRVLSEELGEAALSSVSHPVAVMSASLTSGDAVQLCSWKSEAQDISLTAAAMYTSAAPTFFPSASGHIDGGVWANCPCDRAKRLAWKYYSKERIRLLSLGTGEPIEPIRLRGEGLLGWPGHLIDAFMNFGNKQAVRDCEDDLGKDFARVQVPFLGRGKWSMDRVDREYMEALTVAAGPAQGTIRDLVRAGWIS